MKAIVEDRQNGLVVRLPRTTTGESVRKDDKFIQTNKGPA